MKNLISVLTLLMLGIGAKKADASGYIKYTQAEKKNSYTEVSADYPILSINGSTFIDFYNNGGYLGRTSLRKKILKDVNCKLKINHDNALFAQAGLGIETIGNLNISFMPLWADSKGRVKDKCILGYSGNVDLPKGFKLNFFGEWNLGKSIQWGYGEIDIGKKIGPVSISYNPALNWDGDFSPSLEHRAAVKKEF
jgi:hypothetical protein